MNVPKTIEAPFLDLCESLAVVLTAVDGLRSMPSWITVKQHMSPISDVWSLVNTLLDEINPHTEKNPFEMVEELYSRKNDVKDAINLCTRLAATGKKVHAIFAKHQLESEHDEQDGSTEFFWTNIASKWSNSYIRFHTGIADGKGVQFVVEVAFMRPEKTKNFEKMPYDALFRLSYNPLKNIWKIRGRKSKKYVVELNAKMLENFPLPHIAPKTIEERVALQYIEDLAKHFAQFRQGRHFAGKKKSQKYGGGNVGW